MVRIDIKIINTQSNNTSVEKKLKIKLVFSCALLASVHELAQKVVVKVLIKRNKE